jgi:peroxiredoxin
MAYLLGESGQVLRAVVGGEGVLELLQGANPASASNGASAASNGHAASANGHTPRVPDRSLASSRINRDGLKAGTVAPAFSLPTLDGREIALESFRGKRVLLVFSDPQCAPCNDILPKLEQLHRGSEELQVLLIGRGEREENLEKVRTLGLTFPVVLQKGWEISRAYGMFATPIGYLVGEDGVLLEDVAVGGKAILALPARQPAAVQVGT